MMSAAQLACFDVFIDPIHKEFEVYEQLAADMTHGIVMPRNSAGYDVLSENYKYQVKHSNPCAHGISKSRYPMWQFDFRISTKEKDSPDFCILYGIANTSKKSTFNLFCFLIPYGKALNVMSFRHNGHTEGRINISASCKSWIWDWCLVDQSYESFIIRRNELNLYRQLLLISDDTGQKNG